MNFYGILNMGFVCLCKKGKIFIFLGGKFTNSNFYVQKWILMLVKMWKIDEAYGFFLSKLLKEMIKCTLQFWWFGIGCLRSWHIGFKSMAIWTK